MTKRTRLLYGSTALLVVTAAVLLWSRVAPGEAPPNQPPLITLDATTIQVLEADFNRDRDAARLIVLLSPT
jgi:hypothetical protein